MEGQLWAGEARPGRVDSGGLDWQEGPSEWLVEEVESSEGLEEMAAAAAALRDLPTPEELLGDAAAGAGADEDALLAACRGVAATAAAAAGGDGGWQPAEGDLRRMELAGRRLGDVRAAILRLAAAGGVDLPGGGAEPQLPDWLDAPPARRPPPAAAAGDSDDLDDGGGGGRGGVRPQEDGGPEGLEAAVLSLEAGLRFLQWLPEDERSADDHRLLQQIPEALARARRATVPDVQRPDV